MKNPHSLSSAAVSGASHAATYSQLTKDRRRLVHLAQRLCFGTIVNLPVRGSEPVLDPLPRTIRRKKPGGCNSPRPQANSVDFALKRDWLEFFADLDSMGDGMILLIEVAHGLPLVYEFEDVITV